MENFVSSTEILFSEFPNVRSKCAHTITLQQFVDKLRSDTYQSQVLGYRQLCTEPGREAEAAALKGSMPCIVPAGICSGGHAVVHFVQYSGIVCIDLDHTDGRTEEIMQLLQALPYVAVAFRSISGVGVKVFVRTTAHVDGYDPLYKAVGQAVSRAVTHPYDEKCKTLTQPCYYSYDPQAYYNPQAESFVYVPQIEVDEPLKNTDIVSDVEIQTEPADEEAVAKLIAYFEREFPFRAGQRHYICLKLGRAAGRRNLSHESLMLLIDSFAKSHTMSDFNENDIRSRIMAGYQYSKGRKEEQEQGDRAHFRAQAHYRPQMPTWEGENDSENIASFNDELRAGLPDIPDEVFENLPEFLQRCVQNPRNRRERDIMLLSAITCCSALLPRVSFFYKDRYYSPQLYLAVVAAAGTGKGVMNCVASLLDSTDEYYKQQNSARKKKNEENTLLWEKEMLQAKRERRTPNIDLKPQSLVLQYLKVPATISKSRLIENLAASGAVGCIMVSTEIMSLCNAFKQDYGNFEDVLLKSFQHEEVASSFKIDGEPKVARFPHLSLCLSGTQEQFNALFRTLESGLYSRFMVYTRPQELSWESCAPGGTNIDKMQHFRQLGEELLNMHKLLLESPTLVSFTPAQWSEHSAFFANLLRSAAIDGGDILASIVMRCGLQAMRIAAVFTVFRKYADYPYAKEYVCTDEDFQAAMLISRTTFEHSRLLSTALPPTAEQPRTMQRTHRLENTLDSLPIIFSYTQFVTAAKDQGVSLATAKRWLQKCAKSDMLVKEKDRYKKAMCIAEKGS